MSLKLFHITEFAESSQLSPATQREAIHPCVVVLLAGFWLASACNLPLWRELSGLDQPGHAEVLWFGAGLTLMVTTALSALLSLLSWRWTLKPAITLLLLVAALGAHAMLAYGAVIDTDTMTRVLQTTPREARSFFSWPLFLTLMLLGVLPAVWLWRTPVRRIPPLRNLKQNGVLFMVSCSVLAVILLAAYKNYSPLMGSQPQLRHWLNPINALVALGDIIFQSLGPAL